MGSSGRYHGQVQCTVNRYILLVVWKSHLSIDLCIFMFWWIYHETDPADPLMLFMFLRHT